MACALCGTKTGWNGPVFGSPPSLAGKSACDSCEKLTDNLSTGRLPRDGLDQLLEFAGRLPHQEVAQDLQKTWKDPHLLAEERARKADEVDELASMLVTSGFDFEGWRITGYLGFVTRQVVFGMGLFRGISSDFANLSGAESTSLGTKLDEANTAAFERLKRAVRDMGGDAIIGADLDYTMFGASLVGVIASGTAVTLEPEA